MNNSNPGGRRGKKVELPHGPAGQILAGAIVREARVELYIDRGRGSGDENFAIFDQLFASREQIEAAFRDRLEWQRLDHRRACRIAWSTTSGGYQTVEGRDELFECLMNRMVRLEQALRPRLASLRS